MVQKHRSTVIFGHYLMASGLLGGSIAPIILSNLELEKHPSLSVTVGYIPSCTQILGSIAIVFTTLAIFRNKSSWIYRTQTSAVSKVKVIALWIVGIMLCAFQQSSSSNYEYHNTMIFSKIAKYSSIVFVSLQILFFTWCSRFVFIETRKIKYIMYFLAVVSTINWLNATVLSSIFITEFGNSTNGSQPNAVDHQVICLLSFIMEFSIQATTFAITIPMNKNRENDCIIDIQQRRYQEDIDRTGLHSITLGRKQKLCVAIISCLLSTPFVFGIVLTPTSMYDLLKKHDAWLSCIVGSKVIVFMLLTIAYHDLHKSVFIQTEQMSIDFSDFALIIASSAVAACGVTNLLLRIDKRQFIVYFHTSFNIIYCVYQTIFILFLRFIVIRGSELPLLSRVKIIIIIVVTYNLFYWAKDLLFFLDLIKSDVEDKLFKTLFFLLYPLVSFYRFQSAIGMISFVF